MQNLITEKVLRIVGYRNQIIRLQDRIASQPTITSSSVKCSEEIANIGLHLNEFLTNFDSPLGMLDVARLTGAKELPSFNVVGKTAKKLIVCDRIEGFASIGHCSRTTPLLSALVIGRLDRKSRINRLVHDFTTTNHKCQPTNKVAA